MLRTNTLSQHQLCQCIYVQHLGPTRPWAFVPTVQKVRTATVATECQHQLPWFSHIQINNNIYVYIHILYIYIHWKYIYVCNNQMGLVDTGHKQIWFSGFCTPPTLHKHMRCSCTLCSCFWNSSIIAYNTLLYLLLLTRTGRPPFATKSCQDSIAQTMHRTGSAKSQMPALTICQDWHGLITGLANTQDYPAIPCGMHAQDKLRVDSADWPDLVFTVECCRPWLEGPPTLPKILIFCKAWTWLDHATLRNI